MAQSVPCNCTQAFGTSGCLWCVPDVPPAHGGEELGAGIQLACSHSCAPLPLGTKVLEVQEWQDFKEFGQAGHKPGQGLVPGGNQGAHGKNMRPDRHLHASRSFQRVRICSSLRHQSRNSLDTEASPKSFCENLGCPTTWSNPGVTWTHTSWCWGLCPHLRDWHGCLENFQTPAMHIECLRA